MGLIDIEDFLAAVEEGEERIGRSQKVRVMGMVTTEIKPQKGRDGDYFLRGVIEGHAAALSFTINGIEQAASPALEKLRSPLPLVFAVTPRIVRTEEGTIDRIEATIHDPVADVMTMTTYLSSEGGAQCGLLLEVDATQGMLAAEEASRLRTPDPSGGVEVPLVLKIRYPEKKKSAFFQGKGWLSEERLRRLKSRLGPDGCRFYRCSVAQTGVGQ